MPYLNLDLGFPRHPKVKRLVGLLGRGAEMLLIRLWCHCGEHHCETGALTGFSGQEIESIIEWWGERGRAADALVSLGFIDATDSGFVVHDWLEHSGHLAALKARGRANAQKRWRKAIEGVEYASSNATSIAKHAASYATSIANSNADSNAPTIPSKYPPTPQRGESGFVEPKKPPALDPVTAEPVARRLVDRYLKEIAPKGSRSLAIASVRALLTEGPETEADVSKAILGASKRMEAEGVASRFRPAVHDFFDGLWRSYLDSGSDGVDLVAETQRRLAAKGL
jgi:hypothetical protein